MAQTQTALIINFMLLGLGTTPTSIGALPTIEVRKIPFEYCISTSSIDNRTIFKTQKNKIINFPNLHINEYLAEVPNTIAINTALEIFSLFENLDFMPKKISVLNEGGVLFEYFSNGKYYAIEIDNSGDIAKTIKKKDEPSSVFMVTKEQLLEQIPIEINSIYGDGRTGDFPVSV